MRVKDVMTQNPVCCRTSDSAQSVAKTLRDEDVGSLPVIADADSRRLIGIITDRDLCCTVIAQGLDPATTEIEVAMKRNPVSCRAEQSLDACERLMQIHQVRRIPVVDEQGRCVGMLSQADLALLEQPDKVHLTLAEISKPTRSIILAAASARRAS
jgi:CBS domain-containing protein